MCDPFLIVACMCHAGHRWHFGVSTANLQSNEHAKKQKPMNAHWSKTNGQVTVKSTRYSPNVLVLLILLVFYQLNSAGAFNPLDGRVHLPASYPSLAGGRPLKLLAAFNPSVPRSCFSIGKPSLRARPRVFCVSGISEVDNPHELLRVNPGATLEEIRSAFLQQAKVLHPDVSKLSGEESTERFRLLVEAYDEVTRLALLPKPLRLDFPEGLSADERTQWLINANKVMLFMRGTKQVPSDENSSYAVSMLSIAAFDTGQRFASFNLDTDSEMVTAVMKHSGLSTLPICFIDGELIGGNDEMEELYESGELRILFGGADQTAPCPEEMLEWRAGRWQEPEDWAEICRDLRLERNPISCKLEWVAAKRRAKGNLPDADLETA